MNWQGRVSSSLYERLVLSRDKDEVMKLALEGQLIENPQDIFKDPYVLEFTGLPELVTYSETELENRIIDNLQKFLLELGRGFNNQIFASKYQTVLPSKEELKDLIEDKNL